MKTFAIIKPDAIELNLTDTIKNQLRRNGFTIVREQEVQATKEKLEQHYAHIKDKPFFPSIVKYMTRKPVIILELEKDNAVSDWRKLMGSTNPNEADQHSLRGQYGKIASDGTMENIVHGSDSEENAKKEIKLWFED